MATISDNMNLEQIVSVAKAVLSGEMKIIEGSRALLKLKRRAGLAGELFLPLIAIDSETDHLPVGPERERWSPEALVKKDAEIREVEELYGEIVREACGEIVAKFESRLHH